MGFFDLFKSEENTSESPKYVKTDKQSNGTIFERYQGSDAESARQFLSKKLVDKSFYYIVVETPEGTWGMDKCGIYLEHLLDWQKDIVSSDCDGKIISFSWSNDILLDAATGVMDNYTLEVECGNCKHQWRDGVKYNGVTLVRCPKCKKKNRIDSTDIKVTFFPDGRYKMVIDTKNFIAKTV